MAEDYLQQLLTNEREWRKYLIKKIDSIEEEQRRISLLGNTLKVKVGVASIIFGGIGSFVVSLALFIVKGRL